MPLKVNEKELIRGCMKGKTTAQESLFSLLSPMLLGICLRYAKDSSEAQDFLQESFIKIFKNLGQFEFKGSFEGWAKRITINTCLYNLKKNGPILEDLDIVDLEVNNSIPDVIEQLSATELLHSINQLPDGYRMVFNLYAIEGMSHKEISEQLDIKESTSRSQLVKARKFLKDVITQDHNYYYENKQVG